MFNNKGVSHIIVLVAIIVVAAVGFAGWRVYNSENKTETATVEQSQSSEELQTGDDVKALEEDISSTDLEAELDTSDLDANLSELQ